MCGSDRSVRPKETHDGVVQLRNQRDDASGITLYAAGPEFRSEKAGVDTDPRDEVFHHDVRRSDTCAKHDAQRSFPGRFEEHSRFFDEPRVRLLCLYLQQNFSADDRSHDREIRILHVRAVPDVLSCVFPHYYTGN